MRKEIITFLEDLKEQKKSILNSEDFKSMLSVQFGLENDIKAIEIVIDILENEVELE